MAFGDHPSDMSSLVFILGAGASAESGAPVMRDFLDVAHDLWKVGRLDTHDAAEFERVFSAVSALAHVHSKSRLDINNIESVFAAFEIARTIGYFGEYTVEEIDHLLEGMRTLIAATLEWTQVFPLGAGVAPPYPYGEFAQTVRDLSEKARPRQTVSVITFDYDLGLDFALHWAGRSIDYNLDSASRKSSGMPLLKLHGSLNWRQCTGCKTVQALPVTHNLTENFGVPVGRDGIRVLVRKSAALRHCNEELPPAPALVPPTWNKTQHHRHISSVWGRAAHELAETENIFVIGYSLPESDAFFRYLYALGSVGESRIRRFWVYDINETGSVESRFRSLLGPGAEDRFQYIRKPFHEAIPHLRGHFEFS